DERPRRAPYPHRPCRGPRWQGQAAHPAVLASGRLSGRVFVEIDQNVVAFQHHLVSAQRERARRRLHGARLHVEGAGMQAALDDAVFEKAVGEARGRLSAFVVGDVELTLEIVDGKPFIADLVRLHRFRRDLELRADPDDIIRHGYPLTFAGPLRPSLRAATQTRAAPAVKSASYTERREFVANPEPMR